MVISVDVEINVPAIVKKTDAFLSDEDLMLAIHNEYARLMEPYVPFDSGTLAQTTEITSESVRYAVPYAHYMYEGEIYGDNIPIIEDGMIVGWFSRPGEKKHPTGRPIEYDTTKHPLATSHWDKAMLEANRDTFIAIVQQLVERRARQIYG